MMPLAAQPARMRTTPRISAALAKRERELRQESQRRLNRIREQLTRAFLDETTGTKNRRAETKRAADFSAALCMFGFRFLTNRIYLPQDGKRLSDTIYQNPFAALPAEAGSG